MKINLSDINEMIEEETGYHRTNFDTSSEDYFENFCGACDNFDTNDCPMKKRFKILSSTKWNQIGCKNFID